MRTERTVRMGEQREQEDKEGGRTERTAEQRELKGWKS